MINGVVKWFDTKRGYGFISADDGNDVFVHFSQVKERQGDKELHEGESVAFDIVQKGKGPQAINVEKM
ncbi:MULTISPECIES: cold-shock protein [Clostridium]|uniref:Cold-shock protein n=1 Tax=Clostridium paridis TaxID=2803863 RepID=A0A937FI61_9CLOT|nr:MULTISPECIES: cold-shock protein [Clostridium]MBL4933593.1 cold-shock protein [Clostridium paridis]MDD7796381.1 cold-shock protein [Clostridium sp. 'White wine YQ']